jgi:CelD/BcsL family acetyltransferase involved in cellulose biosynthesis
MADALAVPLARVPLTERRGATDRTEWQPLAALGAIMTEWRELAARALEPNVFYEPGFALAAAPVFGAGVGAVTVRSKGRLIGLFPGRIARRYGVMPAFVGWTHPYAPLGVPLVDRDEADLGVAAFLGCPELPKLLLLPMLTEGPVAAAFARALAAAQGHCSTYGRHERALLVPAERKDYLDRAIGAGKRKELRRQRRRLTKQGPLEVATARAPAEVAAALDDFLSLEASGWKGRAGTAARGNAQVATFMRSAVTALAVDGNARIDRLMHHPLPHPPPLAGEGREGAIAATITLRSGATSWLWKIAYDETHARASPGVQLTLDLTTSLLADATVSRVDSCATADHPMIDHLWRERLTLADWLIAPGSQSLGAYRLARPLETARRTAHGAAKWLRDTIRKR